jgi:hypothetical protein
MNTAGRVGSLERRQSFIRPTGSGTGPVRMLENRQETRAPFRRRDRTSRRGLPSARRMWSPCAIMVLLLFQLSACDRGGAGQVVVTGKTVYAGMAIEEVQIRVLRLDGDQWKESGSGRSGYHGSFIVKTNPGRIRLEARGKIFKNNKEIPLAGRVSALEVPSDTRRMDRIVIELAPVPDGAGG